MKYPEAKSADVWFIDVDDPEVRAGCDAGWLNHSESGCMRACPGSRLCTRLALERCLVKRVVARYLDCDPAEAPLQVMGGGGACAGALDVCWSHGERWLAVVVARGRNIGCEMESAAAVGSWRQLQTAIASREESVWLRQLGWRERRVALRRIRARKVAWMKARGPDAQIALPQITTVDDRGAPVETVSPAGADTEWFCHTVGAPGTTARLALAYERAELRQRLRLRINPRGSAHAAATIAADPVWSGQPVGANVVPLTG